MKDSVPISAILTVYNGERFLAAAVESILARNPARPMRCASKASRSPETLSGGNVEYTATRVRVAVRTRIAQSEATVEQTAEVAALAKLRQCAPGSPTGR